jgi:adenine phosphoribosyltransferase
MATPPIDLKDYVRDVTDFPRPGILFRDVTPILLDPRAFRYVTNELTELVNDVKPDAIIGIESRGFFFGTPVAYALGLPFVPVRKAGKLPAERMSVEFALEYGEAQLDIHADALNAGQRVAIIDDLLATGGTAEAAAKLVQLLGASVSAMAFVVELTFLDGRQRLRDYQVSSLVRYGEFT